MSKRIALFTTILMLVTVAGAADLTWTSRVPVPDRRTGAAPAVLEKDGKLHMVYRGEKSTNLYHVTYDGKRWSRETRVGTAESRMTPAIAFVGSTLHVVHNGKHKKHFYHLQFRDGMWTGERKIGSRSSKAPPALAVVGSTLHMIYRGKSKPQIYYSTFDGRAWSDEAMTPFKSRDQPALAAWNETLHLCYLDNQDPTRTGHRLRHATLKNGRWSAAAEIPTVKTNTPPALVVHERKLLLFRGLNNVFGYAAFDGRSWTSPTEVAGQDGRFAPAIARTGGDEPALHLIYVAKRKNYMWYSKGYGKRRPDIDVGD